MNTENMTPAQLKAIENGGTNNAIVGNSLVKRGVMELGRGLHEMKFILTAEYTNWETSLNESPHIVNVDEEGWPVVEFPVPAHEAGTNLANAIEFPARGGDAIEMDEPGEIQENLFFPYEGPDLEEEMRYADAIEAEEAEADKRAGEYERCQIEIENAADRDAEVQGLREEFETAEDDRRDDIRVRLAQLGTVVYPAGTPQHTKYTTDLRDALREWSETRGTEPFMVQEKTTPGEFLGQLAEYAQGQRTEPRDPRESRYAKIERWTDGNLDIKAGILSRRLSRPHLRKGDRQTAQRQYDTIIHEMKRRGIVLD